MAKKKANDPRTRTLTPDEAALWSKVAETTEPLPRAQLPSDDALAEGDVSPGPADRGPLAAPPAPSPPPRSVRAPHPARLVRRELRQLGSGRAEVTGRIDLHGLRQREAHNALLAYLQQAQLRGDRYVLVITGKGSAKRETGADPGLEPPGVLKRAVPLWLEEPAFRVLVVGHGPAHARHGGAGALYIRVRRPRD